MKPPLPNSYWVEPGLLLAGEHPDGGSERATRERLACLEAAGVRCYLDLTEPGERPAYQGLLPLDVTYLNLPIPDHSVPEAPSRMQQIQRALAEAMAGGGAVYLHCHAGIGRTGIAVGCYLRERGATPRAALVHLNKLWRQNARAARWPSIPETDEQEAYILNWRVARASGATSASALGPLQRFRGCLVGLAVGDAFGSALELPGGQYGWSDDTGMALCVAESLLERGGFDGRDQVDRYREWARDPAAAGAAPGAALRPAAQSVLARALWNRSAVLGSHDLAQADASLLAPCAAAALFAGGRVDAAVQLAADSTRVVQQAQQAVDACRLFAAMLAIALAGGPRERVLGAAGEVGGMPLRAEVQQMAAGWLVKGVRRRSSPQGVLGALDRIARLFAHGEGFEAGLASLLARRGTDRDALGAAWGALAGAFQGEVAIDAARRERVAGIARVGLLAERLYSQGSMVHAPVA